MIIGMEKLPGLLGGDHFWLLQWNALQYPRLEVHGLGKPGNSGSETQSLMCQTSGQFKDSPASRFRACSVRKGVSSTLEQIWVTLDRQGHWLSPQEESWHCSGAGAEAKALKQNILLSLACLPVSIVPGHLLCLICFGCPTG